MDPRKDYRLHTHADSESRSDGVLSNITGEVVVKPCKQSEIDFYESARSHLEFSAYIPDYYGTLSLGEGHSAQAAGAILLPAETSPELPSSAVFGDENIIKNEWTPSGGGKIETDLAIVLENVAVDFQKPNILDVKLGARLWADDAPPAKRARLEEAAAETTSKPLGFRIAGMKAYQGRNSHSLPDVDDQGYKHYDKNYGRAFTVDTVRQGFEDYFLLSRGVKAKGPLRKVIRRFVDDLHGIATAIENEESRMYSASLLFVYEGDGSGLEEAFDQEKEVLSVMQSKEDTNLEKGLNRESPPQEGNEAAEAEGEEDVEVVKWPAIQSLKLIDFAHAQWTPGQGPDENLLGGIRNVAKILTELAG